MRCKLAGVQVITLVGYMDSPFVRRVAVSARFLDVPYKHEEISIFRDYEKFREINPLVKVPTVIFDDGKVMVDSTLIIDYLEYTSGRSLLPVSNSARLEVLRVVGVALVAAEKAVQLIYETRQRPPELHHAPWIARVKQQLNAALDLLEACAGDGESWLHENTVGQADITLAIVWRFVQHAHPHLVSVADYPGLAVFSARAEQLPQFVACPLD
jgi:glutathione S-transferase